MQVIKGKNLVKSSAFLSLGGMVFSLGILTLGGIFTALFTGNYLLQNTGDALIGLLCAWLLLSISLMLIFKIFQHKFRSSLWLIFFWSVGYAALWLTTNSFGSTNFPIFFLYWLILGTAIAFITRNRIAQKTQKITEYSKSALNSNKRFSQEQAKHNDKEASRLAQSSHNTKGNFSFNTQNQTQNQNNYPTPENTFVQHSTHPPQVVMNNAAHAYGRLSGQNIALLTQQVRIVTTQLVYLFPNNSAGEWRDFTIEAILQRTTQDWWQNGNTAGLTAQDIADLQSFKNCSLELAGQGSDVFLLYKVFLNALLDDWLANWNANGVDGPPIRN